MGDKNAYPQLAFEEGVLNLHEYTPSEDGTPECLQLVRNAITLFNEKDEAMGLKWLMWIHNWALQNNTHVWYLDVMRGEALVEVFFVFKTQEEATVFSHWQVEHAPIYDSLSEYEKCYPWLPVEHWYTCEKVRYAPPVSVVPTGVNLLDDMMINQTALEIWVWMQTNCSGRIWLGPTEFWFENAKDATTYKMFSERLSHGDST